MKFSKNEKHNRKRKWKLLDSRNKEMQSELEYENPMSTDHKSWNY